MTDDKGWEYDRFLAGHAVSDPAGNAVNPNPDSSASQSETERATLPRDGSTGGQSDQVR